MRLRISKHSSQNVQRRGRIRARIRQKIFGTQDRPRISVFRSNTRLYVQCIADDKATTLLGLNSHHIPECKGKLTCDSAFQLGKVLGQKMVSQGIKKAIFDRGGYLYHGRVKKLADGIRESGVQL